MVPAALGSEQCDSAFDLLGLEYKNIKIQHIIEAERGTYMREQQPAICVHTWPSFGILSDCPCIPLRTTEDLID
jgi:hypothetical protein